MANDKKIVNVWQPVIRIGHWILVTAFFTAYFTEGDFLNLHIWMGYTVGIYLIFRILWGFIGNEYARFSHFIYTPAKIISYLKNLIARKPQHYIGHNPAGGAMVIALLVSLLGTTITGLKLYTIEENQGPLAFQMPKPQVLQFIKQAKAEENDASEEDDEIDSTVNKQEIDAQIEDFWEEAHEIFANFTLLLVFLHLAGVIASSIIDQEKLVKTMLTGKKEIDDSYQ